MRRTLPFEAPSESVISALKLQAAAGAQGSDRVVRLLTTTYWIHNNLTRDNARMISTRAAFRGRWSLVSFSSLPSPIVANLASYLPVGLNPRGNPPMASLQYESVSLQLFAQQSALFTPVDLL